MGGILRSTEALRSVENSITSVRFEVFTAVTMKNGVFCVVTPCGSCKNRRSGGTWRHFCHPDEGGARFLRNAGSYKSHTA
jgi:hypothetical protein